MVPPSPDSNPKGARLRQGWQGLVQQALVGQSVRQEGLAVLWELFREDYGLPHPVEAPPEQRLLQAAAFYQHLHQSAAELPPLDPSTLVPLAPEESLSYCSDHRLQQVRYALRYQHDEVLRELLLLLETEQTILPPVVLPPLLHYARRQKNLHALVIRAAGARGQWLAQYHPDWGYAQQVDLEDASPFEYGNEKERLHYVRGVLAQDAAVALDLMEQTWDEASTSFKASLLQLLLPKAPEIALPLLERAHQDKRVSVHRAATPLLAQFENSSLVQRLQARLSELITIEEGALCVLLPEGEAALQKDGIHDKRTVVAYQGYKAQLLAQLIGSVPPQWWITHYGWSLERWFKAAEDSLWTSLFVGGWAHAAHRFGAEDWLVACQRWCVEQLRIKALLAVDLEFVYPDLSPALFEDFAQALLTIGDPQLLADEHPVISLLLTPGQPWSEALGLAILKRIQQTIERESYVFHWNLKAVLKHAAVALPARLYPVVEKMWQPNDQNAWAAWQKEIQHLLSLLRFRWEIHQSA